MPSLQIRKLPEHIYTALKEAAEKEHRSMSNQAIVLLAEGLNISIDYRHKRKKGLENIKSLKTGWAKFSDADVASWIREDRDNR